MESRQELQRQLAKLDADLPEIMQRNPEPGEFIQEFEGRADSVMNQAGASDHAWAYSEIDRLLDKYGFSPVDIEQPTDK